MSKTQDAWSSQWRGQVLYPIVYQVTGRETAFILFIALLSGGICIGSLFLLSVVGSAGYLYIGGLALATSVLAVYCVTFAFKASVTLEANAIVVRRAFGIRRIAYASIVGRRMRWSRRQSCPVIVSLADKVLKLTPSVYGLDDRFDRWFLTLPNLDTQDQMEALVAIEEEASQGSTKAEWFAKVDQARSWGQWLNVAVMALAAWGFFYPSPYDLLMTCAAAAPWIAVLLLWKWPSLFEIDGVTGDPRHNLLVLVAVPSIQLALGFTIACFTVDLQQLYLWGIAFGMPLLLALRSAPRVGLRKRSAIRGAMVVLVPVAVAYGIGLLGYLNAKMDRASSQVFHSSIAAKYSSRGRYHSSYELYLSPWHPTIDMTRFSVSQGYYASVKENEPICPRLHRGAMRFRWVELAACDGAKSG